jgi:hypothetical protein
MARKRPKENIYRKEKAHLEHTQKFLSSAQDATPQELMKEFKATCRNYEELLDQTVLITRISDRLQRKLDKTNDKLQLLNDQLNDKNIELQNTIDDLVKAKAGRKATTIVFIFALILFVFSEALIDPYIDSNTKNIYLSLAIKALIAMLIKPFEMLVEEGLLKRARKKTLTERTTLTNNDSGTENDE